MRRPQIAFEERVAELEGFARPLYGIVPLTLGGFEFAHWERIVDGLDAGTVLRVDQRGERVRDVLSSRAGETVRLPDEEAGYMMVFRTFERVSFALVMKASRAIHVHDFVRTP